MWCIHPRCSRLVLGGLISEPSLSLSHLASWCSELYEKAVRIIREYFDGEDEDDLDDMAPEIDFDSQQFAFGAETHTGNNFSQQHQFNF